MPKKNEGAFSSVEQPFNNWLMEAARERASKEGIDFTSALRQIARENPPIAEAARIEATGPQDAETGPSFLRLMRRALGIMKAKGVSTEAAMEQAAVENPDVANAARVERGGSLYATELRPAPGIGDRRVLMSEGTEAALDPSARLVMLANERRDRKSISFGEALLEVGREHPDLVWAAREQTVGRKLR
jgi:hypothetical protein